MFAGASPNKFASNLAHFRLPLVLLPTSLCSIRLCSTPVDLTGRRHTKTPCVLKDDDEKPCKRVVGAERGRQLLLLPRAILMVGAVRMCGAKRGHIDALDRGGTEQGERQASFAPRPRARSRRVCDET